MPNETKMENVPSGKVPDIVKDAIALGANSVECVKQADGNWTVSAKE
jgi:hypothetical protein